MSDPVPAAETNSNSENDLVRYIGNLGERLRSLHQQAVQEYTPVLDHILKTPSRDTTHIEHTLDVLLDFCGHEPALALFRRLCRHYRRIDPAATAIYVRAYRDMRDSDRDSQTECKPPSPEGGDA